MNKKQTKIGIIGGKGKMGSWFGKFFHEIGLEVLISDIDTELTNEDLVKNIVQKDINKFLNGVIIDDVQVNLSENQPNNSRNKIFISIIFTYRQQQSNVDLTINTTNI